MSGECYVHARFPIQQQLTEFKEGKKAQIGKLGDKKKVVQLVGKRETTEIFAEAVGKGKIAKDPHKLKKMMAKQKLVPIPMKEIQSQAEAGKLQPNEVVFVKINHLVQFGFGPNDIKQVKIILDKSDLTEDVKILQISNKIARKLEAKLQWIGIRDSLVEKWSQPLGVDTLKKAEAFVSGHPQIELTSKQRESLISARTGGSNTIQTDPQKRQDWLNAERFVREKAKDGSTLTIDDLCKLNTFINGDDNEEIGGGQLRDAPIFWGGITGLAYVHQGDVESLLHALVDEINTGISKGENPIILAAKAYQRMVSIHPFADGNGRTCRLAMDYVLLKAGLPPPSFEDKEVACAIFGNQDWKFKYTDEHTESTPTAAVENLMRGIQRTYDSINK